MASQLKKIHHSAAIELQLEHNSKEYVLEGGRYYNDIEAQEEFVSALHTKLSDTTTTKATQTKRKKKYDDANEKLQI